MKNFSFRAGAIALLLSFGTLTSPLRAESPSLSIKRAIEIAEGVLASKGVQSSVYIQSISHARSTILSPRSVWVVDWSSAIPGSKPGAKYVGAEINMKGEVLHLVSGRGKRTSNSPH